MMFEPTVAICPYTCRHCPEMLFPEVPAWRLDTADTIWVINATSVTCGTAGHGGLREVWGNVAEVYAVIAPQVQWAWLGTFDNPEKAVQAGHLLVDLIDTDLFDDPMDVPDFDVLIEAWRLSTGALRLTFDNSAPPAQDVAGYVP